MLCRSLHQNNWIRVLPRWPFWPFINQFDHLNGYPTGKHVKMVRYHVHSSSGKFKRNILKRNYMSDCMSDDESVRILGICYRWIATDRQAGFATNLEKWHFGKYNKFVFVLHYFVKYVHIHPKILIFWKMCPYWSTSYNILENVSNLIYFLL